jgi:hypothetical protein
MLPLLQPGLTRTSPHDYRLGQSLDGLFAAHLHRVFGALALHALEVYAIPPPWLPPDTTTLPSRGPMRRSPPGRRARPAAACVWATAKMGMMISSTCSCVSGCAVRASPLRMGLRDGNTSDSIETPVAMEECVALGLEGVRGLVADSKADGTRTLGGAWRRAWA